MRRNSNKKGFTIVELVIVIAVIAILAGVMIPTFSNLVEKANDSARVQTASAAYREAYAVALASDGVIEAGESETCNGITFTFAAGGKSTTAVDTSGNTDLQDYTVSVTDGVVSVTKTPVNPS